MTTEIAAAKAHRDKYATMYAEADGEAKKFRAERDALSQEVARLRDAVAPFLAGGPAELEEILWGDMPDDASGTLTFKLGDYRALRRAASLARGA